MGFCGIILNDAMMARKASKKAWMEYSAAYSTGAERIVKYKAVAGKGVKC